MWKKRDSHILDIYKNDQLAIERNKLTQEEKSAQQKTINDMYQGNEFDVFGKDCIQEPYLNHQFAPKSKEKPDESKRDILLRTESKRGQIEAMLQHTSIIKKRKMSPITTTTSNHVFLKSTVAINSPIASMFVDPKQDQEDEDFAYY